MLRNLFARNTEPTSNCPATDANGQVCGAPATVVIHLKINNRTTQNMTCEACARRLTDAVRTSAGLP